MNVLLNLNSASNENVGLILLTSNESAFNVIVGVLLRYESTANDSVNDFCTNASNVTVEVNSSCMKQSIVKLNDWVSRR